MCDEDRPGERGRQTHTPHIYTHVSSEGVLQHTNDKHAQGDEIKILGGRPGGWDVAIGGLRLVTVRRDSGLRGRLGRHSWRGGCCSGTQNASWAASWAWAWGLAGDVCACACTMQCTAGGGNEGEGGSSGRLR